MKASTYKVNWPLRVAGALACLILITTSMLSGMFARYSARSTADDSARVAVFTVTQEILQGQTAVEQMNFEILPDTGPVVYKIKVDNDSETAVRYTLDVVKQTDNLPIDILLDNADETVSGELKRGFLGIGNTDAEHTLSFAWNNTQEANNFLYHREIEHVVLTVRFEQID